MHVQLYSGARSLNFGPSLHLLLYFEHVSSQGQARLHRCAVSHESCLLANAISIKILSVFVHLLKLHTYLYKIGHLYKIFIPLLKFKIEFVFYSLFNEMYIFCRICIFFSIELFNSLHAG